MFNKKQLQQLQEQVDGLTRDRFTERVFDRLKMVEATACPKPAPQQYEYCVTLTGNKKVTVYGTEYRSSKFFEDHATRSAYSAPYSPPVATPSANDGTLRIWDAVGFAGAGPVFTASVGQWVSIEIVAEVKP